MAEPVDDAAGEAQAELEPGQIGPLPYAEAVLPKVKELLEDPRVELLAQMTDDQLKQIPMGEAAGWLSTARDLVQSFQKVCNDAPAGFIPVPPVTVEGSETPVPPDSVPANTLSTGRLPLPSLKRFSGSGPLLLTEWISDAQNLAELACVDEVTGVRYAIAHLEQYAKKVWNAAQPLSAPLSWSLLTRTLSKGLGIQNVQWNARKRLASLRQTTTVRAYAMQFAELVNSLSEPIQGDDKVFRFIEGLKPHLQKACLVDPSNQNQIWDAHDFDKLVEYALTLESGLSSLQLTTVVTEKTDKEPRKPVAGTSAEPPLKRAKVDWIQFWPDGLALPTANQKKQWTGHCFLCKAKKMSDGASKHFIADCKYAKKV